MSVYRVVLVAVAASLALLLSACGDDETTVTETTVQEAPATSTTPATTSTTAATTSTASTTSTTSSTTTGSTTTSSTADCDFNNGEIYSKVSGGCVQQRSGNNPCPAGEVPMADEAVCVKDEG